MFVVVGSSQSSLNSSICLRSNKAPEIEHLHNNSNNNININKRCTRCGGHHKHRVYLILINHPPFNIMAIGNKIESTTGETELGAREISLCHTLNMNMCVKKSVAFVGHFIKIENSTYTDSTLMHCF